MGVMQRVESRAIQFNELETEFNRLTTTQKIITVAVVFFASIFTLCYGFEGSLRFMVGRFSKSEAAPSRKPTIIDRTKKPSPLSEEEKSEFNNWYKEQPLSRFLNRDNKFIASIYAIENKKGDAVKSAVMNHIREQHKKVEAVIKLSTPPIERSSKPVEENKFVITKEGVNEEGQAIIIRKEYKRWKTERDGSCGFHALLGTFENGRYSVDLKERGLYCENLEKEFPKIFETLLAEIFEKLYKYSDAKALSADVKRDIARVSDYMDVFKPIYEKGLKANVGYHAEMAAILKGIEDLKDNKEETAIQARRELFEKSDEAKDRFVNDPAVRKAFINKLRETHVHILQDQLIELARQKNKPLILHQKDHRGNEITTKYIDGKVVEGNAPIGSKKDPSKKRKWIHVYYEGSHFERVTKLGTTINFKKESAEKVPA